MATLSEIAEQYGVSKSTARRWVSEYVPEALGHGKRVDLDDAQLHALAAGVAASGVVSPDMRIDTRKEKTGPQNGSDGSVLDKLHKAEIELAELRAMNSSLERLNSSLERQNEQLVERLKNLEAALEREQQQSRGFWNRLGQKLLGDGRKK